MICLSWNDAKAYINWLKKETGRAYRLPSEAEWEYAARANSQDKYFFGDEENKLCQYGNVTDQTQGPGNLTWVPPRAECKDGYWFTSPIGSFQGNGFGLRDTIGNVWEWVDDCWNASYKGAPKDGSAWIAGDCERRVLRGGSWLNNPYWARSANRLWLGREVRHFNVGFRVVQDL